MSDNTLIFSLISLGFFGGFSHCIGMCGPLVLTQVGNRLKEIPLDEFSGFARLKNMALLPYQLGRITTYSCIGFCCSLIGKNIEDITNFRFFSAFFLFIATLFFIQLLFEKKFPLLQKINLPFKSNFLKNISFLFQNPKGLKGYLLGLILGLIPCGLLYGAFAICVAIKTPSLAAAGMFLFGLATFPALFLTAWSGFIVRITEFKILTKIVILINIITLFSLALKQI